MLTPGTTTRMTTADANRGGPVTGGDPGGGGLGRTDETWIVKVSTVARPARSVALTRMTCDPTERFIVTWLAFPNGAKGLPSTLSRYPRIPESLSVFFQAIETGGRCGVVRRS